jgi:hypothetical protein
VGALALVPFAHRDRHDAHLIRLYIRLRGVAQERVHVGPVAHKDRITPDEGAMRLILFVLEPSLRATPSAIML